MKYKLYIDKDTYINSRYTSRNYGAEQVIEISANTINGTREVQRALFQVNLNSLSSVKNSNLFPQSLSSINSAKLVLINTEHGDNLVEDETIELYPITSSWVDGRGIGKSFADYGFCNYIYRDKNNQWNVSGSDFVTSACASLTSSVYSQNGTENLVFDITNLVKAWDNGSLTNNGVVIKLQTSSESSTSDIGYKKVYSENTHTFFYPYIVFDYNWEELNDRHEVWPETTQRLYTDVVRHYITSSSSLSAGVSAQLWGYNTITVTSNISYPISKYTFTSLTTLVNSIVVTALTGVWVSTTGYAFTSYTASVGYNIGNYIAGFDEQFKKYYVDINISSLSAGFSYYRDVWYFNNGLTSQNEFYVRQLNLFDYEYDWYVKTINKNIYPENSKDKIRVVFQNRNSFNLTPTYSVNNDFYNVVLKDVYYEIIDDQDNVWVEKTLCSRSKEYNYFYLLSDQFPINTQLKIKIYYISQGIEYNVIAGTFKIV